MSERPDIPEFITNSKYFYSDSDYFNIIDYKASPTKKALKSTYFFKLYKRLKDKVRFRKSRYQNLINAITEVKTELQQFTKVESRQILFDQIKLQEVPIFSEQKSIGLKVIGKIPKINESYDFTYPTGAYSDIHRQNNLPIALEKHFNRKFTALDLGCAGGGVVWDFLIAGNHAIGLEGSASPKHRGMGYWPILQDDFLFNINIVEKWNLNLPNYIFDVVTAWEFLEHIEQFEIPILLGKISRYMQAGSIFMGSIGLLPSFSPKDKQQENDLHLTKKHPGWWMQQFEKFGFLPFHSPVFSKGTFVRGIGNGPSDPDFHTSPLLGFHFLLKKK